MLLVDDRGEFCRKRCSGEPCGLFGWLDGCVLVLGETFCACAEHDIVWMLILNC